MPVEESIRTRVVRLCEERVFLVDERSCMRTESPTKGLSRTFSPYNQCAGTEKKTATWQKSYGIDNVAGMLTLIVGDVSPKMWGC